jgi:hypothetical protein
MFVMSESVRRAGDVARERARSRISVMDLSSLFTIFFAESITSSARLSFVLSLPSLYGDWCRPFFLGVAGGVVDSAEGGGFFFLLRTRLLSHVRHKCEEGNI